jgi:hypothetical protein
MPEGARTRRHTRAISAVALALMLLAGAPARADGATPPPQTSSKLLPLPAPGTTRLIRIGPQEAVTEDDQGQVTPVEETTAKQPTRGQNVAAAATMMGIVTGGLFLFLRRQSELTEPIFEPR